MAAIISDCGRYRYRLERRCCEGMAGAKTAAIIMVNPSTADAEQDDPTIRKIKGFANRNGWGRVIVGNLFAYRATDIRDLARVVDPVGRENAQHIARILHDADVVVFAWGPVAKQPKYHRHLWRAVDTATRLAGKEPMSIGSPAKCGHPKHPLMLSYSNPIVPWTAPQ